MQTDSTVARREKAKADLKTALAAHNGDTKEAAIVDAIALLASLNPTPNPAHNQALLEGDWLLISAPNFPGKLLDEANRYVYTLGKLAFNKFEPVNLRVAIDRVLQPTWATKKENEYSYDIVVEFRVIEQNFPELRGIVKNLAFCSPIDGDTVQVVFAGGELTPLVEGDSAKMKQWLEIFDSDRSTSQASFLDRLKFRLIQTIFGMGKTSAINPETGTRTFTMSRSPKGKFKILYLDEELRITQGNRETVYVCQRQN